MGKIERVFIIGWDGAGNFVRAAHTPNLDRLISSGTFAFNAQTVSPTISAQCWGALLHGVGPDKHGLTNERASEFTYPDDSMYPSIFRIVHNGIPDAKMAAFSVWNPINHGIIESSIGVHKVAMNDRELPLAAAAYIRENPDLKLMFIGLDLPDAAGHQYGYNTPEQLQAIEETDAHTGIILRAIEESGIFEDSLIIVVSDHGGGGEHPQQHGSDHPSDKTIFWGCAGPGIQQGASLQGDFFITDTAEVVIRALGLDTPDNWEAKLPEGLFQV
ncbi:alkaline phosphatase family protein [Paenibacillus sp. FJAT-27812]|uniref:alkaline phosphatase family protein n=1 Tax=Paenibacillus sp. FJAT-27812 TaxID=1684143 RepID=UPI0006A75A72|nr:alkaline phosphatase family protein [Paenibacillus sp. FJAT-27812]